MTNDKEVDRRSRQWTTRFKSTIPYGPFARISDWWCATRDARKGLPALPPDDWEEPPPGEAGAELGTPRMMFLGQSALIRIEKEWIVFQAEIADLEAVLRDLMSRQQTLSAELSDARARLSKAESAKPDVHSRVAGEERTDESIVQQRRTADLAKRHDRASAAVKQLTDEIDGVNSQIARISEQLRIRLRVAQRRAAMIEAHSRRRCAAYLTRLVRRHPDGVRLNELLRPRWPEQPEWARAQWNPETDWIVSTVPTGRGPFDDGATSVMEPAGS
jgi:hypothetical protein